MIAKHIINYMLGDIKMLPFGLPDKPEVDVWPGLDAREDLGVDVALKLGDGLAGLLHC